MMQIDETICMFFFWYVFKNSIAHLISTDCQEYFICVFHIYSHHFTPHGRYELNKLASLPMCGFIAQLVEHRTGIAEVTGSSPVEALIFSGFFPIA